MERRLFSCEGRVCGLHECSGARCSIINLGTSSGTQGPLSHTAVCRSALRLFMGAQVCFTGTVSDIFACHVLVGRSLNSHSCCRRCVLQQPRREQPWQRTVRECGCAITALYMGPTCQGAAVITVEAQTAKLGTHKPHRAGDSLHRDATSARRWLGKYFVVTPGARRSPVNSTGEERPRSYSGAEDIIVRRTHELMAFFFFWGWR